MADYILGLGRRKRAIAKVFLKKNGTGKFIVNDCDIEKYFSRGLYITTAKQPLTLTNNTTGYDVMANVNGGGHTGQSQAIRLGLARALVKADEANKKTLKVEGFLTRDSREVERKKYGQAKARKRYQFSKR